MKSTNYCSATASFLRLATFCLGLCTSTLCFAQGAVTQVADLNSGSNGFLAGGVSDFDKATFFDGKTFFTMRTPETGAELWVTDGTAPNTRLIPKFTKAMAQLQAP